MMPEDRNEGTTRTGTAVAATAVQCPASEGGALLRTIAPSSFKADNSQQQQALEESGRSVTANSNLPFWQQPNTGWIGPQDGLHPVIARLEAPDGSVYAVTKTRVVIGRESTHSDTDLVVQENNYVSRGHLVLQSNDDGRWAITCNGKNGVLVNGQLVKKQAEPTHIPNSCFFRFPSTSVRVAFRAIGGGVRNGGAILNGNLHVSTIDASGGGANPSILPANEVPSHVHNNDSGFISPSITSPGATGGDALISPAAMRVLKDDDELNSSENGKPPFSYAQLIVQAIASTPDRQMTLSGIYAYITRCYPWYRSSDKGWQNSIRHNLSLNRYFIKVPRSQEEPGKGSFWKLDPASESKLLQFANKKRRQRSNIKGIRSAPASPGLLDGWKSDAELFDVFPGDTANETNADIIKPPSQGHARSLTPQPTFTHSSTLNPSLAIVAGQSGASPGMVQTVVAPTTAAGNVSRMEASILSSSSSTDSKRSKENDDTRRSSPDEGGVFRFSPTEDSTATAAAAVTAVNMACSRYIHSAPCSPKGFGKAEQFLPKREHHHSGGPFRVRTSAKDGRHRLQLCHSPPEYVPVARADISALQSLTQQSTTSSQQRKSRSSLLAQYRGGSQSLSTTPVRELLGGQHRGGPPLDGLHHALLSPEPKVLKRRHASAALTTSSSSMHNNHHSHQPQQISPLAKLPPPQLSPLTLQPATIALTNGGISPRVVTIPSSNSVSELRSPVLGGINSVGSAFTSTTAGASFGLNSALSPNTGLMSSPNLSSVISPTLSLTPTSGVDGLAAYLGTASAVAAAGNSIWAQYLTGGGLQMQNALNPALLLAAAVAQQQQQQQQQGAALLDPVRLLAQYQQQFGLSVLQQQQSGATAANGGTTAAPISRT